MQKETVLAFGDTHAGYQHPDTLAFLKAVKKKYKPSTVVCLGDVVDLASIQVTHPNDPDGSSFGEEMIENMVFLKELYKVFPKVKACYGNHDLRIARKASLCGIPSSLIQSIPDLLGSPKGWSWKDSHKLDGVIYTHGIGVSGISGVDKLALTNMCSTVIGHCHTQAKINYHANKEHLIFSAVAGCLIDNNKYAFRYAKYHHKKPIISCMVVIDGVPSIVPMPLNKKGRWTQEV